MSTGKNHGKDSDQDCSTAHGYIRSANVLLQSGDSRSGSIDIPKIASIQIFRPKHDRPVKPNSVLAGNLFSRMNPVEAPDRLSVAQRIALLASYHCARKQYPMS
jgi:hypothetical protein